MYCHTRNGKNVVLVMAKCLYLWLCCWCKSFWPLTFPFEGEGFARSNFLCSWVAAAAVLSGATAVTIEAYWVHFWRAVHLLLILWGSFSCERCSRHCRTVRITTTMANPRKNVTNQVFNNAAVGKIGCISEMFLFWETIAVGGWWVEIWVLNICSVKFSTRVFLGVGGCCARWIF